MDPQLIEELKGRLGMVIGGRWKLVKILGLGASAGVYRGTDEEGWRVAVKVMHSRHLRSKIVRERFIREQSILDQVQHRHTLRIYETSETLDGLPYIVMELLEGQTLARIMSKRGEVPLEIDRVVAYMLPVLEALELCHHKQILHRDLKPANIFLTQEGVIKLLDFGVARYHQDGKNLTRDGATLGTPSFMSPEQASGKMERIDARSDLFGVGATMHYLLSGQYIHDEETAQMTYLKAATTPAPSLARHAPHLSADLVALVDRAVAWNPQDRWQTAAEFSEQLRDAMTQRAMMADRQRVETIKEVSLTPGVSAAASPSATSATSPGFTEASLRAFWSAFERALAAVHRHGVVSTISRGRLEECEATLRVLIERARGELCVMVHPYGMVIEGASEAAGKWLPPSPLDEACYLLSASGVRRLRFLARQTHEDLLALCQMLAHAQQDELGKEDDLATAIWGRQIVGMEFEVASALGSIPQTHYEVMDHAFALQLDAIGETVRSEFALERERLNVLRALDSSLLSQERFLGRLRHDAEADMRTTSALQMHEDDLLALRAQHRKQRSSWAIRLGTVMSDVVLAAHERGDERLWLEPLGELALTLAAHERVEEFMSLLAVMMKRLTLPQARRALGSQVFTPRVLRELLVALGVLPPADDRQMTATLQILDASTCETLTLLLGHLDARHLDVVLDALCATTEPAVQLRAPLLEMIHSGGGGHAAVIGKRLERVPHDVLGTLIDFLGERGAPGLVGLYEALELCRGERALDVLRALFATPHNRRNHELLTALSRLAWHEKVTLRQDALRLVAHHRYEPFVPEFERRFSHQDFHVLSMDERREHFALLRALAAPSAEQVCIMLLTPDDSAFTQEFISSQLLAIEDLARHGYSQEALHVLDASRRPHPQRSRDVQHAAQQAYARFCARHQIASVGE